MASLKVFVFFGVVFGPSVIQGQYCPRTSREANTYCASECVPSLTCSSNNRECICDGDCGYSCIKKDLRCRKPRNLENGQRRINSRKFKGTAIFTCDAGYTLSGSSVRRCRSGAVWDGVEPKCDAFTCPKLNTSRTILANISGYEPGSTARFSCNDTNFILSDDTVISCRKNYEWSAGVPECLAPCYVNATENLISKKVYQHGSKADLKCNDGFLLSGLIGTDMLICSNGKWNLEGESCGSRIYPYCTKNEVAENIIQDLFSKAEELARKLLENLLKKTRKN